MYSMIPICRALGLSDMSSLPVRECHSTRLWVAVALLEASFHINNFVLVYIAAILEKKSKQYRETDKGIHKCYDETGSSQGL